MTDIEPRLRILLVEDEKINRDLIRAILARANHPTLTAAHLFEADTLASARVALAAEPVDILLLDVNLPDGSGLTLAQEISHQPAAHRPTIIALTAGIFPEQQRAAFAAGCQTILSKPHTAGELLTVLANQLHPTGPDN
ncbi:MAG TPA: response regulator [Mycobacteriales bacterium]|nr:response regulator [Mycobacteriales bacterium]